jgi:hypothetical protein
MFTIYCFQIPTSMTPMSCANKPMTGTFLPVAGHVRGSHGVKSNETPMIITNPMFLDG